MGNTKDRIEGAPLRRTVALLSSAMSPRIMILPQAKSLGNLHWVYTKQDRLLHLFRLFVIPIII
jgi:hypothetical protein